ncbi:MAG: glycosyltransferase [Frankiales bacterium]|nr:glycosyltransferase [Frankiales bacterium]
MVLSPRGMLGPAALNFSSMRKSLFWRLLQARAVAAAHCLHATSESEWAEIRALGHRNPVAIIPNGVDIAATEKPQFHGDRVLLTLGRIHPKKGLAHLIRAWAAVEAAFPDWRLRIVGPDEDGHAATLQALARELGVQRITIEDPLFDDAKLAALQGAEIFVLPTLNENFALTVAEALAAGTPVIASKGSPWQGLEARGCGWWVDVGSEPLAAALAHALAQPAPALRAMGENGRRWMAADFSWRHVAARMIEVYDWLTVGAAQPSHVRLS